MESFNSKSALIKKNSKIEISNTKILIKALARSFALFVMSFLTLFCLGANLLTVGILFRHQPLQKSVSNLYILSLSMADALVGLLVMPIMAINEILRGSNGYVKVLQF